MIAAITTLGVVLVVLGAIVAIGYTVWLTLDFVPPVLMAAGVIVISGAILVLAARTWDQLRSK